MITLRQPLTVTVVRGGSQDATGDRESSSEFTIDGCAFWPESSSENTDRRETAVLTGSLAVPRGRELRSTDKVLIPGQPGRFTLSGDSEWDQDSMLSGTNFGFKVYPVRSVR